MKQIKKREDNMFKKVEPLNNATHQNLRFVGVKSFDSAMDIVSSPLVASEVVLASKYYPIVFPTDGVIPVSLFSLGQKKNFYVNDDGSWKAPYVPAHIRRYPFILGGKSGGGGDEQPQAFTVCIDVEAPHFASDQGEPLFTADGQPAPLTQKAIDFLKAYQEDVKVTQGACSELETHGVLVAKKIDLEKSGEKRSFGGFRCVDVGKMNELDDSILAGWVRNGLMRLIVFHLQSLNNLKILS
ncbi:SapC family protein [Desulfocicer vacuolatum]|nr:SapC family protein [Desulfocicer vacuolatum]